MTSFDAVRFTGLIADDEEAPRAQLQAALQAACPALDLVAVCVNGVDAWDAWLELNQAIPVALKKGAPGTREFRVALRDALEGIRDPHVSNGVVNMSKNDHLGLDQRARVVVKVEGNKWKLDLSEGRTNP